MDTPIVACIQHHLIVPKTADDYPTYLNRFLRMAKSKGAVLALFPEWSGIATAIPTLSGWRNDLLRAAGQPLNGRPGFWDRTKSAMAGGAASMVQADLHKSLVAALQSMPESLHDAYVAMYSNLARQHEMTLVAGSVLEVQPDTQEVQNVCIVFGPDGSILGRQAKVSVSEREAGLTSAGSGWNVIATPAGRVGILLGEDALYPESGRVLAYQGADMLLSMAAVNRPATYQKIRQAALARCQENQLYGMVAFLTGPDPLAGADAPPFVGASSIFAPSDFTPRFSGVMVEIGSPLAEGVITAEWDYPALIELWDESDTPLRRNIPLLQAGTVLAGVFARALPLSEAGQLALAEPASILPMDSSPMASSDVPVALPGLPPDSSQPIESMSAEEARPTGSARADSKTAEAGSEGSELVVATGDEPPPAATKFRFPWLRND